MVELTKNGGLGLGFRVFPYLFQQWGGMLAIVAGVAWFGLLFFAGITSSLAMGTPIMGFLKDEFGWSRESGAWAFGICIILLGLPTVLYFKEGVFDEYDYWAGTVSLVVFALAETILFAWLFGMRRGWAEITRGADIKVPIIFKYIICYVTPFILMLVFGSSLVSEGGVIDTLMHTKLKAKLLTATVDEAAQINTQMSYLNYTRFGLLAIWLFIAGLVYVAYKKRLREGWRFPEESTN